MSTYGFRLSYQQVRQWQLNSKQTTTPFRSLCLVSLSSNLCKSTIKHILQQIVSRHEILRTSFVCLESMSIPLQVINEDTLVQLTCSDSSTLDEQYQPRSKNLEDVQHDDSLLHSLWQPLLTKQWCLEKGYGLYAHLHTTSSQQTILALGLPALLADHDSITLLLNEFSALSNKQSLNNEFMQYADYAQWQEEHVDDKETLVARNYWQQLLKSLPPPAQLPLTISAPKTNSTELNPTSFYPKKITKKLLLEHNQHLKLALQYADISIESALFTCWATILSRICRQSVQVINIACSDRQFDETQNTIGPLTRYVPVKILLEEEKSFRQNCQHMSKQLELTHHYSDCFQWPSEFESSPHSTINNFIAFTYHQSAIANESMTDSTIKLLKHWSCDDLFQLKLSCSEQFDGSLLCSLHYNSSVFTDNTAEVFLDQFYCLLREIFMGFSAEETNCYNNREKNSSNKNQYQTLLDYTSTMHNKALKNLVGINQADLIPSNLSPVTPQFNIIDSFKKQASLTPNQIAVKSTQLEKPQQLTYLDLEQSSNQLAHYINEKYLGNEAETPKSHNAPITIILERGPIWIQAILTVLKLGTAYVPLEKNTPIARITTVLESVHSDIILTQESIAIDLKPLNCQVICLDTDSAEFNHYSHDNFPSLAAISDLAYIIFTSGTTGLPKGVAIEHQHVLNYAQSIQNELNLEECRSYAHVASFAADLGNTVLFPALLSGACLHIFDEEQRTDPHAFADIMSDNKGIDCLKISPSHLTALLDATPTPSHLLPQKKLILGGEIFHWQLADNIQQLTPQCEIYNHYGPTETTVGALTYLVDKHADNTANTVPIGKPLPHVQLRILNSQYQAVGIGMPGELYIGGYSVSRGYLNDLTSTEQRFINFNEIIASTDNTDTGNTDNIDNKNHSANITNILLSTNNQYSNANRFYRTGDKVRRLPSGLIEFLGRTDRQVNIKGYRVELGEIETSLLKHSSIQQSAVLLVKDKQFHQQLVAFYVLHKQSITSPEEINNHLHQILPHYMIPTILIPLEVLPLSNNGKVDINALEKLSINQFLSTSNSYSAPVTSLEKALTEIWEKVLNQTKVGIEDNFFELGGDSILSIQIVSQAKEKKIDLSPQQLFEHKTIKKLAHVAKTHESSKSDQQVVTGEVLLTPIQHWFFEQSIPDAHHWNLSLLLELSSSPNIIALQKALHSLLNHHDALRIYFVNLPNGKWRQYNEAEVALHIIEKIDLTHLSISEQNQQQQKHIHRLQTSLDLSKPPLVSLTLFHLHSGWQMFIVVHHLLIDGISWWIFLESLYNNYSHFIDGKKLTLPPKTCSFKHWSKQLSQYASSARCKKQLPYWLSVLENPPAPLPRDNPSGINTAASANVITTTLKKEQTTALLKHVPMAYHTQINDVLLCALGQTFYHWTSDPSLLIELESHGREALFTELETYYTIGWFTSRYPYLLTLPIAKNVSTSDYPAYLSHLLQTVKEQLRSIPHNGIDYGVLRYLTEENKTASNNQLSLKNCTTPEVSFNYLGQLDQHLPTKNWQFSDTSCGQERTTKGNRTQLIAIDAMVIHGQLKINWTYSDNIHSTDTIQRLAQDYIDALITLINHCSQVHIMGSYTPSDFPNAQLNQQQLDNIVHQFAYTEDIPLSLTQQLLVLHSLWENLDKRHLNRLLHKFSVEDIYTLSPMQQGMLFDCMLTQDPTLYIQQKVITLRGNLHTKALRHAWLQVCQRHPSLRTAFLSQQIDTAHQVVLAQVDVSWTFMDWSSLDDSAIKVELQHFLQNDKNQGFNLDNPPLMRLALCKLSDEEHYLIWTHHHLIIDGWCNSIILNEVLEITQAFDQSTSLTLPPTTPYRHYITWYNQQITQQHKQIELEQYWVKTLTQIPLPTILPGYQVHSANQVLPDYQTSAVKHQQYQTLSLTLPKQATLQLQQFAQHHNLTLSNLLNSAWALTLYHHSQQRHVVMGVTLSGRTTEISSVENIVGLLMNVLPLRLDIHPDMPIIEWLNMASEQQTKLLAYQHSPLSQVRAWANCPQQQPLFNSLITFENYPINEKICQTSQALYIKQVDAPILARYPLALTVETGQCLTIHASYNQECFSRKHLQSALQQWILLLEAIPQANSQALQHWLCSLQPALSESSIAEEIDHTEHKKQLQDFNADLEINVE